VDFSDPEEHLPRFLLKAREPDDVRD